MLHQYRIVACAFGASAPLYLRETLGTFLLSTVSGNKTARRTSVVRTCVYSKGSNPKKKKKNERRGRGSPRYPYGIWRWRSQRKDATKVVREIRRRKQIGGRRRERPSVAEEDEPKAPVESDSRQTLAAGVTVRPTRTDRFDVAPRETRPGPSPVRPRGISRPIRGTPIHPSYSADFSS